MTTTTKKQITKTWTKISESNCVVSSEHFVNFYQMSIGNASDAYHYINLNKLTNLVFDAPVFLRLPQYHDRDAETVVVTA